MSATYFVKAVFECNHWLGDQGRANKWYCGKTEIVDQELKVEDSGHVRIYSTLPEGWPREDTCGDHK